MLSETAIYALMLSVPLADRIERKDRNQTTMARKRKRGRPSAISQAAALMGKAGGTARAANMTPEERTAASVHAGAFGGRARAAVLSPEQRRAIAKKAAAARWGTPRRNRKPAAQKGAPSHA